MKKAVAYARISTNTKEKRSIDTQFTAIEEYCEFNNIQLIKKYKDEGFSGVSDERPAFQEMIQASEDGLFDFVVVHKLDRFSRSKYDNAIYKRRLKENGVRIISVLENLDDSPESPALKPLFESLQWLGEED